MLVISDIVQKIKGKIQIYEIKSSTRLEDHFIDDCAIQNWVSSNCGFEVDKWFITHLNSEYLHQRDRSSDEMLVHAEITDFVKGLSDTVSEWVSKLETNLLEGIPQIQVGTQCNKPRTCPFKKHCQSELGEYPVTILPNSHKLIKELLDEGYKDIRDVPSERLSKDKHKIIQEVSQSQIGYVSEEINNTLMGFNYPRHYLDFESIQLSVPIWEGTRPSMQIPFQWSCHIENMNHEVKHFEFLAETRRNPEINFLESLIKTLGNEGVIFVYSHFEKTRLKALAERYPNYEQPITEIIERFFDLLPLLKSHFYHHSMKDHGVLKKFSQLSHLISTTLI